MTEAVKYRFLTSLDKRHNRLAKQIYEIADEAYPTGSPWLPQAFKSDLFRPESRYMLASVNDQIVGFLGMTVVLDQVDITNVAVLPQFQDQHVATGLFQNWFQALPANTDIFLEVRLSNKAARRLYQALGFVQVGQRKRYYRDPEEDAAILKKTI